MSDDEHVSNEELEAAREMEMDDDGDEEKQPQPKKNKAEAAEEEEEEQEEEEEEKAEKRDDSDDNSEKSDEAMEDNEEPEVDGDSREPSDGESIDGEESETEAEKRMRKAAALRFLDIEADEGTEKKIIKHLKKKIEDEDDENAYEKDSIMDDEGVITYDTDYEEERKRKKGKGAKADKKKTKRRRIVTPPSSDDEEEAAASSSDEEEAEQIEEVSDDELQNMQTLAGTSKKKKVGGATAPKGKAAFHEHSDIAKAVAEKKNKKISPESLLDSPKKSKPAAAPKKQAAAKADGSSSSSAKKPAAKKPRKSKAPKNQLGDIFELKEKGKSHAWRITFRGEDAPMTLSPSTGKYELMPNLFHPKYFCTAEKLGETDTGIWDELGIFELFFTSATGNGVPKKIHSQWATSGWNTFNSQSNDERYQYVIDALNHSNIVKGTDAEGKPTKRKMFTDELLQQIKSEAVLNPDGEWSWMPKHMEQHDFITPRKADGSAAVSVKATAAAADSKKKPAVQPKPKIDRHKETSSHDVKAMLSKPASNKKEPAAAASSSSSSKIESKKAQAEDDFSCFFGESPEPAQMKETASLYGKAKALPNAMLMLAQFIEMTFHRMATSGKKAAAVERIQRFFETVDETLKTMDNMDETLSLKQKCDLLDKSIDENLPKEMSKGFYMIVLMLPFFNAEAAQMMRDQLAGLENK